MKQSNIDRRARDKRAAVVGAAFFAGLMLVCAATMVSLCFVPNTPGWAIALLAGLSVFFLLFIIPALVVMKQRFQEIERGELYEASEY